MENVCTESAFSTYFYPLPPPAGAILSNLSSVGKSVLSRLGRLACHFPETKLGSNDWQRMRIYVMLIYRMTYTRTVIRIDVSDFLLLLPALQVGITIRLVLRITTICVYWVWNKKSKKSVQQKRALHDFGACLQLRNGMSTSAMSDGLWPQFKKLCWCADRRTRWLDSAPDTSIKT